MVFARRRPNRPGRRMRRRINRRAMIPRGLGNRVRKPNVYSFKRNIYVPDFVAQLATDNTFNFIPQLNLIPNYTEFTALFDQYRFLGVKFTLIPRFNITNASLSTGTLPSQIMSALDYDGTGPTNLTAIQQYQTLKVTRGTATHKRYFKPAVLTMLYETSTSTAYGPKWKQWIDASNVQVPHYGLYGIIPGAALAPTNPPMTWDLQATIYLQCKTVR